MSERKFGIDRLDIELSRRRLLVLGGGAAAAVLLGCDSDNTPATSAPPTYTKVYDHDGDQLTAGRATRVHPGLALGQSGLVEVVRPVMRLEDGSRISGQVGKLAVAAFVVHGAVVEQGGLPLEFRANRQSLAPTPEEQIRFDAPGERDRPEIRRRNWVQLVTAEGPLGVEVLTAKGTVLQRGITFNADYVNQVVPVDMAMAAGAIGMPLSGITPESSGALVKGMSPVPVQFVE